METAGGSQPSQTPNLVEDEENQFHAIVEALESLYSEFTINSEVLWQGFKQEIEEACSGRVGEVQQGLAELQNVRSQGYAIDEQFNFAIQYVASISETFGRK